MFFREKAFLSPDAEAWQIECWAWHLCHTGGLEAFRERPLVLPNSDFFPSVGLQDEALVEHIFRRVQELCGMSEWKVDLEPHQATPLDDGGWAIVEMERPCGGTFQYSGDGAVITYNPDLLDQPFTLVAMFAHEFGHYLNGGFEIDPPGGEDLNEPATDISAAFMGFGIFSANDCLNFKTHSDGMFSASYGGKAGYLSEKEWVFALAIFLAMRGMSHEITKPFLKNHLFKWLQKAQLYLQKRDIIAKISQILETPT